MNTQRDVLEVLSFLGLIGGTACGVKTIDNTVSYFANMPSKSTKEHTR